MQNENYHIFDCEKLNGLSLPKEPPDIPWYKHFVANMFQVMGIAVHPPVIYDERVLEVMQRLEACDCIEHSIRKIAMGVAISPSRLSHIFKEQTGIPLKSYILLHMVQKAYLYLLQNGNITDAALTAGFDSPSHFAAASKRLTGMSARDISKDSVFLKVSYI